MIRPVADTCPPATCQGTLEALICLSASMPRSNAPPYEHLAVAVDFARYPGPAQPHRTPSPAGPSCSRSGRRLPHGSTGARESAKRRLTLGRRKNPHPPESAGCPLRSYILSHAPRIGSGASLLMSRVNTAGKPAFEEDKWPAGGCHQPGRCNRCLEEPRSRRNGSAAPPRPQANHRLPAVPWAIRNISRCIASSSAVNGSPSACAAATTRQEGRDSASSGLILEQLYLCWAAPRQPLRAGDSTRWRRIARSTPLVCLLSGCRRCRQRQRS